MAQPEPRACFHSRRRLLTMTGTGAAGLAATALLTACGDTAETTAPAATTAPTTSDPTAPTTSAATSTAPSTSTSTSAGSGSGTALMALSAVAVGSAVSAKDPSGAPIIVVRTGDSEVTAVSAICTHQGCTVAPKGSELLCPCHGSIFEFSGQVRSGVAKTALPSVAVHVSGDQIYLGAS